MAVHQISMLNGSITPDSTGRCWLEPYDVIATNDVWKHMVIRLANPTSAQVHGFYGQFTVPQNYVDTAVVIPVWTSTATSGNCRMRLTYRTVGGDDTTSLDQTSNEEQLLITDAAPTAAHRRMMPSFNVTDANFTAGETVTYLFERLDDSGADTMAADSVLFDMIFEYADA